MFIPRPNPVFNTSAPSFSLSGNIVDLLCGEVFHGDIDVQDGVIAKITRTGAERGATYYLPPFVDAHGHVESSMMVPSEFARLSVVHGTCGFVADPHEIANVLGVDGVRYMIDNAEHTPYHFAWGAPSCVPATPFETAGSALGVAEVRELLMLPRVTHLAEVMAYPMVLAGDERLLSMISSAQQLNKPVDGHAPGLRGELARRYIAAGIPQITSVFPLMKPEKS